MATSVNTDVLLEWFQDPSNRSYFNTDLLCIKQSAVSSGVGVFAKKSQNAVPSEADEEENNLLLRVHKSMVLSAQTCTLSNLLYDHGLSGMYGLVLAFIYERELKELSPWHVYLNTINYRDSKGNLILPLCLYSEKDKKLLQGSEVEFMGGLDCDDLESHFQISRQFAQDIHAEVGMPVPDVLKEGSSIEEFGAITMAVASRAFEIDNYIPLGLVPGADLFNHDPYGDENVHFVTLGEVCPFCGTADGCWHGDLGPPDSEEESEAEDEEGGDEETDADMNETAAEESDGEEDDDEEEVEELEEITMDYVARIEKELKEEKEQEQAAKEEEEGENEDEDEDDDSGTYGEFFLNADECCDIVLERKIVKNKEVFNTYGELPNSVLLVKYGFAVEDNPYDSISLGPQIVSYGREHPELEERIDWWSCMGWVLLREEEKLDEESDDEEGDEALEEEGDDEEEDDEEESWLFHCRIDHPGKPNQQLRAVSTLFTMPQQDFDALIADEDCDGELIQETLVNKKPTPAAKALLKSWIQDRYGKMGDGKARSGELKRNLKKCDPQSTRYRLTTAMINEKKILEKALKL